MKLRLKNTRTTLTLIAIIQIIGGLLGFISTALFLIQSKNIDFNYIIPLFLFGFSLYSGILLLQNNKIEKGLILSSVLQIIQIVSFSFSNYIYSFCSGLKLSVGIKENLSPILSLAFIKSQFSLSVSGKTSFIEINIIAIIILLILIDIYKEKTSIIRN